MKFEDTRLGQLVRFAPEVYAAPYAPYYDAYKGHVFQIDHFRFEDPSDQGCWLICLDNPDVTVQGYVWPDTFELVE